MRRERFAKIVATLGPASATEERIEALFLAGADVFRLNFSHGSHEDHAKRVQSIRNIERKYSRPISILLDLQGPKLRIGTFENDAVELKDGQSFRLDLENTPGNEKRVQLPHPEIFAAMEVGLDLLLDDGKIRLKVQKFAKDFAETQVIYGGRLSNRKGVNVPGAVLPLAALTEKDRKDLTYGLTLGIDWVALSFVQRPSDVAEARKLIQGKAALMSKLEKPSAIGHLSEIIDLSDGIMVARGDLGVEMLPEEVPGLQKKIIRASRHAGKPVIVATQMLESMIKAPAPTRAEASDVATAVYDGADAVMLSAETAAGDFPIEAVSMMDRIIHRVEHDDLYRNIMDAEDRDHADSSADAISAAAKTATDTLSASAIVSYTSSGLSALRAARERPLAPIIGMTANINTARKLALTWGVHAVHTEDATDFSDMAQKACIIAKQEGFAAVNERIIIIAGVPFGTPGSTNVLHITRIPK